jgi:hypothetical protein
MKIIIRHTQSSVDPSATYSDSDFPEVLKSLETAYESELRKDFPEAEIEFEENDGVPIQISGIEDYEEYVEAGDRVQYICETVYETGNFWT